MLSGTPQISDGSLVLTSLAANTTMRLKTEFVYLAVILDGFSRKVVGWSLERTLASRLALAASEQTPCAVGPDTTS